MSTELKSIKACVFDAYGTLFDVATSARECAADIGEDWTSFSNLWRQKQLEYTWLRSLMGHYRDFWTVTGEALDYALEVFKIENPALRARLMELYLHVKPYPEAETCLKTLRERGIKTAILSNGSKGMLISAVRRAGFFDLFDDLYSVDDIRIFKTHPSTYQMAVDGLGVAAEDIAFQSSNAWDAAGATAFGFQVAWVNRFNQPVENLGVTPKCMINDLSELSSLIKE